MIGDSCALTPLGPRRKQLSILVHGVRVQVGLGSDDVHDDLQRLGGREELQIGLLVPVYIYASVCMYLCMYV